MIYLISQLLNNYLNLGVFVITYIVISIITQVVPVFAADDLIAIVNNLSSFMFGLIRATGMIILGFGIIQIGMSLKSHDLHKEQME